MELLSRYERLTGEGLNDHQPAVYTRLSRLSVQLLWYTVLAIFLDQLLGPTVDGTDQLAPRIAKSQELKQ